MHTQECLAHNNDRTRHPGCLCVLPGLIPCAICNPRTKADGTPGKKSRFPHKCWENYFRSDDPARQERLLLSVENWKRLNEMRWALVEKKYMVGLTEDEKATLITLSKKRYSYEPPVPPRIRHERREARLAENS